MDTPTKLKTLALVAQLLNGEGIVWAVGASAMLYLKGRVPSFHDIDIMVSEEQAQQARQLLHQVGKELPTKPHPRFRTRHFYEFVIDGVDVDLMAGYVIVDKKQQEHQCPLCPEDITETVLLMDQPIPLHSLERWSHYYELMGKAEKAARCRAAT